jgi:hypothetical protein
VNELSAAMGPVEVCAAPSCECHTTRNTKYVKQDKSRRGHQCRICDPGVLCSQRATSVVSVSEYTCSHTLSV